MPFSRLRFVSRLQVSGRMNINLCRKPSVALLGHKFWEEELMPFTCQLSAQMACPLLLPLNCWLAHGTVFVSFVLCLLLMTRAGSSPLPVWVFGLFVLVPQWALTSRHRIVTVCPLASYCLSQSPGQVSCVGCGPWAECSSGRVAPG